jgi:hypothetical protein
MTITVAAAEQGVAMHSQSLEFEHSGDTRRHPRGGDRSAAKFGNIGKLALAALALATSASAMAAPVVFNFNSVTLGVSNPNDKSNGLGSLVGSSEAIGSYMTSILGPKVTVSGALATASYNGEGHVVGPTLGTSDGLPPGTPTTPDIFIINNNFAIGAGASDRFSMTFENYSITSLAFDWEIFPDYTCSKTTNCGKYGQTWNSNWPDIELFVNNDSTATWSALALGTIATAFDFTGVAGGVNKLTFVDWPAEIGIDNLTITGKCLPGTPCRTIPFNNVPEPSTLPLVALALATLSMAALRTRRKARIGV